MLGPAIATELQLLVARERAAGLAASFQPSRVTGSTPEEDDGNGLGKAQEACSAQDPLHHPAAA